ncbi:MAG: hypothetical protein IRY99_07665 [Isosphaeraceae bacterium]|nr:hypothetical protein [Isosphaeraceae bacterium]
MLMTCPVEATRTSIAAPSHPARSRLNRLIWACLALAAAITAGLDLWIGLAPEESEHLETTLVLAAAHALGAGPAALYGPYSGENPWVLIQAPLYYRLTTLAARPLVALGSDPIWSCRTSGRLISLLSFLACLALAARLAVLDGEPRWAAPWAALLLLSSGIAANYPVTTRPDMLGVTLQTLGFTLALRWRERGENSALGLIAAYGAFGLAISVKQHYVALAALTSLLLALDAIRGRARLGPILTAYLVAAAVVVGVFGVEEWRTGGLMSESIFYVPSRLTQTASGNWQHAALVLFLAMKRAFGTVVLAVVAFGVGRHAAPMRRLDAILGAAIALELAEMIALCRSSGGAWYNYALQAAVLLAVLVGRRLARLDPAMLSRRRSAVVGLAAVVLLAVSVRSAWNTVATRLAFRAELRAVLESPPVARHPSGERYFSGVLQHLNARYGRCDLTHDEWLYESFEAVAAAEPRSHWLRAALTSGPIRLVVVPYNGRGGRPVGVNGIRAPLSALGYAPVARLGRYFVWERR